MKNRWIFFCVLVLLPLTGCGRRDTLPPAQAAYLKKEAALPVTCVEGKDCKEKWNRALVWVTAHTETRLKTVTPDLIQTHDVVYAEIKPSYKVPEFTVVRYEIGGGVYRFEFSTACDDEYGCGTPGYVFHAEFHDYVMGAGDSK